MMNYYESLPRVLKDGKCLNVGFENRLYFEALERRQYWILLQVQQQVAFPILPKGTSRNVRPQPIWLCDVKNARNVPKTQKDCRALIEAAANSNISQSLGRGHASTL